MCQQQQISYNFPSLQKPYACQLPGCSKRYTDPSSLRKHVKNHAIKNTFAGRRKSHREFSSNPKTTVKKSSRKQIFSESDMYVPPTSSFTSCSEPIIDDIFVQNHTEIECSYENSREISQIFEVIDNTDGNFGNVDDNGFYEDNSGEFISYDYLKKFIDSSDLNNCQQYF